MNILLLNHHRKNMVVYENGLRYPYALLKIGRYLKEQGHEVRCVDANHHRYTDIELEKRLEELKESFHPDRIYLSSVFTYFWKSIRDSIDVCKDVFPDSETVLGGNYPKLCPEHAHKTGADKVVKTDIEGAEGLWTDPSILEYEPDFDVIRTSKGCPRNCDYCATSQLNNLSFRDPEDVVDEIEHKVENQGIDEFRLIDDNPLLKYEDHMKKIIEGIERRDLDISFCFHHSSGYRRYNREILEKIERNGYDKDRLYVSFESSQKGLLERMNRDDGDFWSFLDFVVMAKEFFPTIKSFLLLGFPGQRMDELVRDVVLMNAIDTNPYFSPFTPVPGTKEFERIEPVLEAEEIRIEDLKPLDFAFFNSEKCEILRKIFGTFQNHVFSVTDIRDVDDRTIGPMFREKVLDMKDELWEVFWRYMGEEEVVDFFKKSDEIVREKIECYMDSSEEVLEIGSGSGNLSKFLNDKCCSLTTVDFTDFSEKCVEKVSDNHINRDFMDAEFSQRFDLLVDGCCTNFVEELDKYIEKLMEVCKNSGTVFLISITEDAEGFLKEHLPIHFRDPEVIEQIVEEKGFETVERERKGCFCLHVLRS